MSHLTALVPHSTFLTLLILVAASFTCVSSKLCVHFRYCTTEHYKLLDPETVKYSRFAVLCIFGIMSSRYRTTGKISFLDSASLAVPIVRLLHYEIFQFRCTQKTRWRHPLWQPRGWEGK